jgi:hypothetical protein
MKPVLKRLLLMITSVGIVGLIIASAVFHETLGLPVVATILLIISIRAVYIYLKFLFQIK